MKLRGNTIRKREWTAVEIAFLKANAATMRDEDIATKLSRNLKSVREKRRRLNIPKASGRGVIALKGQYVPKSKEETAVETVVENQQVS
jgi:hypothetical protein